MFSSDYIVVQQSIYISQRPVSMSATTIEKQKHNRQRCAVGLRIALNQYTPVLTANTRRDYVPVRRSNYQDSSYVVARTYTQVAIIGFLVDHRVIALARNT